MYRKTVRITVAINLHVDPSLERRRLRLGSLSQKRAQQLFIKIQSGPEFGPAAGCTDLHITKPPG